MKTSKWKFALAAILVLAFFSNSMASKKDSEISVTVQVNYGSQKAMRDTVIKVKAGVTALEALQHVSKVATHPKGNHVFVVSIDNVEGVRGVMAWYYEVNSKPTKKLAIFKRLKDGDVLTWIYRKDVCSCTVDKVCSVNK